MPNRKGETSKRPPSTRSASYGAELLIESIIDKANATGQTPGEVAASLNLHPSHWYKLRQHPQRLLHCERSTLERMARRAEWPLGRVYLAAGILEPADLDVHLSASNVILAALNAVEHSAFAAGLATPLRKAAHDHQRLIAELYLMVEQATLRETKVQ